MGRPTHAAATHTTDAACATVTRGSAAETSGATIAPRRALITGAAGTTVSAVADQAGVTADTALTAGTALAAVTADATAATITRFGAPGAARSASTAGCSGSTLGGFGTAGTTGCCGTGDCCGTALATCRPVSAVADHSATATRGAVTAGHTRGG
jgi:hypothetical protein